MLFRSALCPLFAPILRYACSFDRVSLVVLATDGFFEWENDQGEQFGVLRMEESIRASRDSPPVEIITRLYETVNAFSRGTKQQDDLTGVIIKRL